MHSAGAFLNSSVPTVSSLLGRMHHPLCHTGLLACHRFCGFEVDESECDSSLFECIPLPVEQPVTPLPLPPSAPKVGPAPAPAGQLPVSDNSVGTGAGASAGAGVVASAGVGAAAPAFGAPASSLVGASATSLFGEAAPAFGAASDKAQSSPQFAATSYSTPRVHTPISEDELSEIANIPFDPDSESD